MFRPQSNQFDDVINKATDENLTAINWEFMMDAWDKVNDSGESGPKEAVASLIKRLAHRNANVQIYTLELANSFSQNCDKKMHRELASRSFTEALLRLASDRATHQTVKAKILEVMGEWTEMFKSDPDLGVMEQAYQRLRSQNPNIQPPSKPHKREITDLDRQKEEEELQMALAISLRDNRSNAPGPVTAGSSSQQPAAVEVSANSTQRNTTPPVEEAPHTTAATVSRVRALYDFDPSEAGELAFKKGDVIAVLESVYKDWWKGSLRGQVGIFPLNYVEKLAEPTADDLRREAHVEAEVFAEVKNVEKLLALLSQPEASVRDNDEITKLYHSTLAIRPKLIELIGKYSQKKDDFVSLNEKFIKARRDYEALLETSMSHPQTAYGRQSNYYNDGYSATQPPQNYYTANPHPSVSPVNQTAYPPPSNAPYASAPPSGGRYGPPDTQGSSAFYFIPPGGQPQGPPADYQRPPSRQQTTPAPSAPPADQSQPHELATSQYDTPTETRPYQAFQGVPSAGRPVSPARQPDAAYQPYQRPGYSTDPPRSPVTPHSPYGAPSASSAYPTSPGRYPPGGSGGPQDYYRSSEVYLREGQPRS